VRRIVPRVLELLHRRQQGVVDVGQLGRGLLLQARGRVTAAEVAEELEVSVKTARRDLESLSTAGLPV
jgi:predicted transcriptional regulator